MGLKMKQEYQDRASLLAKANSLFDADIYKVMTEGPAEKLSETMITQPAMVLDGYVSSKSYRYCSSQKLSLGWHNIAMLRL